MNINRIIISGNLVANPTLRKTSSGTPVASATIANNEFFNDAAKHACEESGSYLHYIAEIPDEQLPKRRSLIVGTV